MTFTILSTIITTILLHESCNFAIYVMKFKILKGKTGRKPQKFKKKCSIKIDILKIVNFTPLESK